jgi:hypothetical protein
VVVRPLELSDTAIEGSIVRHSHLMRSLLLTALISTTVVRPGAAEPAETASERLRADEAILQAFRPAYPFWQHIFTIPDGRIAFGSERDGRLIATFPTRGDWASGAVWSDPALSRTLAGVTWPAGLDDRRQLVVQRLAPAVGPLLHNPTRGLFLLPNVPRFGPFVAEWSRIYERFGVPADIGLSQAVLESGLDGTARSRSNALGLCQWLRRNWQTLNRLSAAEIEAFNQTTQAPYCAAYLSILATMYGSFIPALSEHHSGGVNVGRALINGERLGGVSPAEQYLMGSRFASELRAVDLMGYRDLYRTYGIRSFRYAEMVFGNTVVVQRIRAEVPQQAVFAMRTSRALTLGEITARTKLTAAEVTRFNPALKRTVPRGGTLYLPSHLPEFGTDVAFWHRPPAASYTAALDAFLRLDAGVQRWHEASFETVLQDHRQRFADTRTEEGRVMAAMLAYVIGDLRTSRRAAILHDFRNSGKILELFKRGAAELKLVLRGATDQ